MQAINYSHARNNFTYAKIKKEVAKALKQVEKEDLMSIDEAFNRAKDFYRV